MYKILFDVQLTPLPLRPVSLSTKEREERRKKFEESKASLQFTDEQIAADYTRAAAELVDIKLHMTKAVDALNNAAKAPRACRSSTEGLTYLGETIERLQHIQNSMRGLLLMHILEAHEPMTTEQRDHMQDCVIGLGLQMRERESAKIQDMLASIIGPEALSSIIEELFDGDGIMDELNNVGRKGPGGETLQ